MICTPLSLRRAVTTRAREPPDGQDTFVGRLPCTSTAPTTPRLLLGPDVPENEPLY
jgi:hypothetical protein